MTSESFTIDDKNSLICYKEHSFREREKEKNVQARLSKNQRNKKQRSKMFIQLRVSHHNPEIETRKLF